MRTNKISYPIILLAMVLLPFSAFSQLTANPPPEPQRANATPPPPPGLPIDDHLPLLLLAGIGLGLYVVVSEKTFKKVL